MIKVTLQGRPLSTNHIYWQKEKVRYLNKNAKKTKSSYILQLYNQYRWDPLEGDLCVEINIYRYWAEPDFDNVHKLSMDACNKILRVDDKQVKKATIVKFEKDNKNPRMEIIVQKY